MSKKHPSENEARPMESPRRAAFAPRLVNKRIVCEWCGQDCPDEYVIMPIPEQGPRSMRLCMDCQDATRQ